jgi:hypothetical protein
MSSLEIGSVVEAPVAPRPAPPSNLNALFDQLCASVSCTVEGDERVSLGHLLDTVGRRAYGPLLLLIGLFSISPITVIPGMTWLSATLTLVVAAQMLVGRANPWLPRSALRTTVPRRLLVNGVNRARPVARCIDALLKPRMTFLSRPPLVRVIAAMVMAAAVITYPLGFIPGAPLAPGVAVVLFGLGMSTRDGLVLLLAGSLVGLAGWGLLSLPVPGLIGTAAAMFFPG